MTSTMASAGERMSPYNPAAMAPVPVPASRLRIGQPSGPSSIVQSPRASPPQFQVLGPDGHVDMPSTFYDVPECYPAVFSTNNGKWPKKVLEKPYPLTVARSKNREDAVYTMSEQLRTDFPTLVRSIVHPKRWEDLYQFFDGLDLWINTPTFCYWVINHIADKNQLLAHKFQREIETYASEWVLYHQDLVQAATMSTDLLTLFQGEEKEGLQIMTKDEIRALKAALERERQALYDSLRHQHQHPPVKTLYPVAEGFPGMVPPYISSPNSMVAHPVHRVPVVPLHPVQVQAAQHQNFDNFMQIQQDQRDRFNYAPPKNVHPGRWALMGENRPRGMSNETMRNGSASYKPNNRYSNQNGRRTVSNTPRPSPPRPRRTREPSYYQTGEYHRSPPHGPAPQRIVSNSSNTHSAQPSNDAKIPVDSMAIVDFQETISPYGNTTRRYILGPNPSIIEEQNPRTAYIAGVFPKTFFTNQLHQVMSTYGAIESITFVPLKDDRPTGQAFVTYTQPTGVYLAIERANGMVLPTGDKLFVNHSKERNNGRQRSNSQLSAGSYGQSSDKYRQPRSFRECNPNHARRQSFRNEPFSFNNANRPLMQDMFNGSVDRMGHHGVEKNPTFGGIEHSILSTVSEVAQQTLSLKRHASQMPLTSIENVPKNQSRADSQASLPRGTVILNNENSPIKESVHSFLNNVRVKPDSYSLQEQGSEKTQEGVEQSSGGGKKKKASRQNTSAQPSPAPSPIKSRSEVKLNDMYSSQDARRFVTKEDGYQTDQSVLKMPFTESSKPENTNQEKKHSSKKANRKPHLQKKASGSSHNGDAPPQSGKSIDVDEGADSAMSPTDGQAQLEYHSKSSATSFSRASSHGKPGIAPRVSDAGLAATSKSEASNSPTLDKPASQSFGKAGFGTRGKKSSKGSFDHQKGSTASIAGGPDSNPDVKDKADSQSSAKIRPQITPEVEKELPIPPPNNYNSTKEIQSKDGAQDTRKEIKNQSSQSDTFQNLKTHTKKSSSASATSSSSLRNADAKTAKAPVKDNKSQIGSVKSTDSLDSSGEPATPIRSESPTETIFMDLNHWPALGPSNSPHAAIADGKRPPPIVTTLRPAIRKTPGGTIVPAVPVIKKPRTQSEDPLGGPEWPFVKRCKPL